ncbi:MalY/PatB family protein [Streptomyces sulphureus]|uniref:MalY/PatB family protein n=1 Tax=Streptomyces sulphureus TaxID=47758 RepID=UPI00037B620D|nr:aminotransferase class I/II-fold pyridoxal phosphate-dependent enzyme [Streptomyces sulphureus]
MRSAEQPSRIPAAGERPDPLLGCTREELRRRTSAKWSAYPPDVLPLWVAEMDVPLAPAVVDAVQEALRLGDTGYPFGTEYAEALDAFARARWGWSFPADRTALVPDVMQGMVEILKLTTSPGDAVVVNSPVYTPIYQFCEHLGRKVLEAPLGPDRRIDFAALATAFADATSSGRTAAWFLCNPHNPTGTVHTGEELAEAAQLAEAHGVRVVADEIHAPLVLNGAHHTPYLSVPGAERGFSLLSASKAWNLAGLKAAVAVAGDDAADELARIPEEVSHGPSHVGVLAHTAALRYAGEWLDALLAGLDRSRRLLGDLLAAHLPAVGYRLPEATILAWLDCRALGLGDDPAAAFLDRGRVALTSGPAFGTGGEGRVRLNYATSPDILEEAVARMASVFRRA